MNQHPFSHDRPFDSRVWTLLHKKAQEKQLRDPLFLMILSLTIDNAQEKSWPAENRARFHLSNLNFFFLFRLRDQEWISHETREPQKERKGKRLKRFLPRARIWKKWRGSNTKAGGSEQRKEGREKIENGLLRLLFFLEYSRRGSIWDAQIGQDEQQLKGGFERCRKSEFLKLSLSLLCQTHAATIHPRV